MTPEQTLGALLKAHGAHIAVAESITAGQLQAAIASVSGASAYFAGGLTAYSLAQKVRHLGVDPEHAAAVNCVSEQVARQMALGVAERFAVTVSAATTGYAGPWKGARVPYAYYAVLVDGVVTAGRVEKDGLDRQGMQRFVARTVIAAVNARLQEAIRKA